MLKLDGARYQEHGTFGRGEMAASAHLDGFFADVDAVFEAPISGA